MSTLILKPTLEARVTCWIHRLRGHRQYRPRRSMLYAERERRGLKAGDDYVAGGTMCSCGMEWWDK